MVCFFDRRARQRRQFEHAVVLFVAYGLFERFEGLPRRGFGELNPLFVGDAFSQEAAFVEHDDVLFFTAFIADHKGLDEEKRPESQRREQGAEQEGPGADAGEVFAFDDEPDLVHASEIGAVWPVSATRRIKISLKVGRISLKERTCMPLPTRYCSTLLLSCSSENCTVAVPFCRLAI